MSDDPWLNIEERYSAGDIVEGTVVTLVNTGAFVEIGDEIEGFLSNTELSWTQKHIFRKEHVPEGTDCQCDDS